MIPGLFGDRILVLLDRNSVVTSAEAYSSISYRSAFFFSIVKVASLIVGYVVAKGQLVSKPLCYSLGRELIVDFLLKSIETTIQFD